MNWKESLTKGYKHMTILRRTSGSPDQLGPGAAAVGRDRDLDRESGR